MVFSFARSWRIFFIIREIISLIFKTFIKRYTAFYFLENLEDRKIGSVEQGQGMLCFFHLRQSIEMIALAILKDFFMMKTFQGL